LISVKPVRLRTGGCSVEADKRHCQTEDGPSRYDQQDALQDQLFMPELGREFGRWLGPNGALLCMEILAG
jgi:hypothetical protein